jgi:quercetin dioxygenase-like cupin family protein
MGVLHERKADVTVIVEEIAVGDTIPLHRNQIDEVIAFQAGEERCVSTVRQVRAGDLVIIPPGAAHGTKNIGGEAVRISAFFPSHRIDIEYIERNPAPGTEGNEPQPPVVFDTRTGWIESP